MRLVKHSPITQTDSRLPRAVLVLGLLECVHALGSLARFPWVGLTSVLIALVELRRVGVLNLIVPVEAIGYGAPARRRATATGVCHSSIDG